MKALARDRDFLRHVTSRQQTSRQQKHGLTCDISAAEAHSSSAES